MDRLIDMWDTFMVRRIAKAIDRTHETVADEISLNRVALKVASARKLRRIPRQLRIQAYERALESEARLFEAYNRDTVFVPPKQLDQIVFEK